MNAGSLSYVIRIGGPMGSSQAHRGGVLMGLLITGISLVCLAVVIGLAVARNIRVHTLSRNGGDDVSIETPAGNFSVHARGSHGSATLDVSSYPGARHKKDSGGGASFEWTSRDGREGGMTVAGDEMITDDPADRVVEFYKSRDPHWIVAENRRGHIRMELVEGGYKRFVAIQEKGDGTHIGVASIGGPAAN